MREIRSRSPRVGLPSAAHRADSSQEAAAEEGQQKTVPEPE